MGGSRWLALSLFGALACSSDATGKRTSIDPANDRDAAPLRDGGAQSEASSTASACEALQLTANPNAPEILIVQDRSGSMSGLDPRNAGKNRWDPSVRALKALTAELTSTVAFGLMLFPSTQGSAGPRNGGPGCEPGVIDVPPATHSASAIATVLDDSKPDVGATPTTTSLMAALAALDGASCADCRRVPRYVLLVTDGQPTCGLYGGAMSSPQDIAATNEALDALERAGIHTYVIGYDTGSDPAAAAAMDGFAQHGGTERHYPVEDEASLLSELTRIASALVPCEFELSQPVSDPEFVRIEIDGVTYEHGRDWHIEGTTIVLNPEGGACPMLKDARFHDLRITRECEPVIII